MRQYRYITKTKPQGLVAMLLPVIRNYVEYDADELWTRVTRWRSVCTRHGFHAATYWKCPRGWHRFDRNAAGRALLVVGRPLTRGRRGGSSLCIACGAAPSGSTKSKDCCDLVRISIGYTAPSRYKGSV
jgi:hypothetical protein